MLGKLLLAIGETPYVLRHGTDRAVYHIMLVPAGDDLVAELKKTADAAPTIIPFGKLNLLPLPLEPEAKPGWIDGKLYDTEGRRWTATIALMRFK